MPEKDPGLWGSAADAFGHLFPWITTLFLSGLATLAQYAAKVRAGEKFSWSALALDGAVCIFAAIVTHMICEWYGMDGLLRSVLVAISAHSGTRAMMQYERFRDRMMGIDK
jgi:hypothetical protein